MKIMIVGSDKVYAIENFYVKYLRELGVMVNHFPAQRLFYDHYQQSIFHKILYRSGLSGILNAINQQLKDAIDVFSPDVIWVFKGMEILPETLQWAKDRGVKLVNFNGDSPFLFSGKGSGNQNVTQSIGLYDLHLTYSFMVKQEMEGTYKIPSQILPFGFDVNEELYALCAEQEEVQRVCFLGNPDKARGRFLDDLVEQGVQLDLYGHDWDKFIKHPGVDIYPAVYAEAGWKALRRYRVQLNMMRPHNPDTHNMRSFELGGIGGIQLAPATVDHKSYFEIGKEIFLYNESADCIEQINKLLALDKDVADNIRAAARERSIRCGYSYRSRAQQALQYMRDAFGEA